jgi:hypothetical protein
LPCLMIVVLARSRCVQRSQSCGSRARGEGRGPSNVFKVLTRCLPAVLLLQSGKLGTVLRSLGFTPTEADVEEMQGKAGATVNFDALLGFISAAKAKTIKEPDVVEALKVFDKDGNGFIKTVRVQLTLCPCGCCARGLRARTCSSMELRQVTACVRGRVRVCVSLQDEVKRILSQLGEKLSAREVSATSIMLHSLVACAAARC